MKKTIKMNERELHRLISESVKRVLNEHEDDWFEEYDTAYIGRTSAYYGDTDDNWWVNGGKSMVIAVSLLLILIGTTYFVVRAKPKKSKWQITGLALIFFIAPLLSWIISMTIGIYYGEGFAAAGMLVITFPILEIISISVFIRGIMLKKQQ